MRYPPVKLEMMSDAELRAYNAGAEIVGVIKAIFSYYMPFPNPSNSFETSWEAQDDVAFDR